MQMCALLPLCVGYLMFEPSFVKQYLFFLVTYFNQLVFYADTADAFRRLTCYGLSSGTKMNRRKVQNVYILRVSPSVRICANRAFFAICENYFRPCASFSHKNPQKICTGLYFIGHSVVNVTWYFAMQLTFYSYPLCDQPLRLST